MSNVDGGSTFTYRIDHHVELLLALERLAFYLLQLEIVTESLQVAGFLIEVTNSLPGYSALDISSVNMFTSHVMQVLEEYKKSASCHLVCLKFTLSQWEHRQELPENLRLVAIQNSLWQHCDLLEKAGHTTSEIKKLQGYSDSLREGNASEKIARIISRLHALPDPAPPASLPEVPQYNR